MEKKIIRTLNVYYYGVMVLSLLACVLVWFLVDKEHIPWIDMNSELGKIIQTVIVVDALLTIPAGLYFCKRKCKALSLLTDENEKIQGYFKAARMRILLVSNTMFFALIANCLLVSVVTNPEQLSSEPQISSMMALAAMSAIAWWFTKPSEQKMQAELEPQDPNQEQY